MCRLTRRQWWSRGQRRPHLNTASGRRSRAKPTERPESNLQLSMPLSPRPGEPSCCRRTTRWSTHRRAASLLRRFPALGTSSLASCGTFGTSACGPCGRLWCRVLGSYCSVTPTGSRSRYVGWLCLVLLTVRCALSDLCIQPRLPTTSVTAHCVVSQLLRQPRCHSYSRKGWRYAARCMSESNTHTSRFLTPLEMCRSLLIACPVHPVLSEAVLSPSRPAAAVPLSASLLSHSPRSVPRGQCCSWWQCGSIVVCVRSFPQRCLSALLRLLPRTASIERYVVRSALLHSLDAASVSASVPRQADCVAAGGECAQLAAHS